MIINNLFVKNNLAFKLFPSATEFYLKKISSNILNQLFFEICKKFSVKNFIDCGANIGDSSLVALNKGFNVIAIEPNPHTFKNIIVKPCKKFTKINIGLGDKDSVLKLYFPKHFITAGYSSFLKPLKSNNLFEKLGTTEYAEISVTTLDKLNKNLKINKNRFALWIDVEGMQKEVLIGAKKLLNVKNCKVIKIEVDRNKTFKEQGWAVDEIQNYLNNQGYEAIFRDFEYLDLFNIIFIKKKDKYLCETEINKSLNKVYKNITLFKVIKYWFHKKIIRKFFLNILPRTLKKIILMIFGLKKGNAITKLLGSKSSKNYLKISKKKSFD